MTDRATFLLSDTCRGEEIFRLVYTDIDGSRGPFATEREARRYLETMGYVDPDEGWVWIRDRMKLQRGRITWEDA